MPSRYLLGIDNKLLKRNSDVHRHSILIPNSVYM